MAICERENLNQVDLINPSEEVISEREYRKQQREQKKLDAQNAEMEADGIQFKKVKIDDFNNISYIRSDGESVRLDRYDAQKIWKALFDQKLIKKDGTITKQWDSAVVNDTIELPEEYLEAKYRIIEILNFRYGFARKQFRIIFTYINACIFQTKPTFYSKGT